MRLYFLRHGLAGDPATWTGDDFYRPLTAEGHAKMRREAQTVKKILPRLDLIVTSPLVRAKQTAQIVADALNAEKRLVEDERVGHGFDVTRLSAILEERRDLATLMLVGHEPSMSQTMGRFLGGAHIALKKGGLARIDIDDPAPPVLVWLLPPKLLAR